MVRSSEAVSCGSSPTQLEPVYRPLVARQIGREGDGGAGPALGRPVGDHQDDGQVGQSIRDVTEHQQG